MKTKILITGVAGFIGSALAKKFVNKGYSVLGIDNLSTGNLNRVPKEVDFIKFDLSKIGFEKKIDKNIKYVLHLSGQSSGEISLKILLMT